ncbi:histone-lysine N-methyltransferase PRDM16-like [Anopheles cruzii]|uniref:histone-lysine N-methyltransferase PRDM16-like n=1 Tax=Anopheles cruzii TaxID=68878 RepID=UPI0022EC87A9|nr:histone-lysine N-methyltransferase PRDM16-like [Anopheles cruzii]
MSETQFVCDLCHQRYSTFEILMTHNRLRHYHTIKCGCGYCNETFRNEDDLYCHFVLTHHVDPYAPRESPDGSWSASTSPQEGSKVREMSSADSQPATGGERCPRLSNSESEDGSAYEDDDDDADQDDEGVDFGMELNYNELYVRRKRSALTQEEIAELADEFKKTVQATYTTKVKF